MDKRRRAEKLIQEHVREHMPDEIKHIADHARADLNFGPGHNGLDPDAPFPGFETACNTIKAWLDDNAPSEVWVDLDCGSVATSAPEGEEVGGEWQEPYTEETHYFDRPGILRATFGELGEYLR